MYMKILLGDIMYRKNISVRQLSLMTGIPKSTISNIMNERYSPTLENLEKIAIALEVKISDLYESEYK
ncbi:MAG: helix-turn-helix domain-containing protein [Blautia massiliensis (ex Durand et al. 2017)]|uniref:helix-turn-helix domain-containing protein n=1 Tax=Blautia massiliensis (ex Durand et al. 2017) TaxID=1737424 RepID=UPI0039963FEB